MKVNYFKIYLFLIHIILETWVFPNYLTTIMSGKSVYFYTLLLGGFFTCALLKNFNRLFVISFSLIDIYFGYELIKRNYDPAFNIPDLFYVFLLYAFIMVIFAFSNSKENFQEYKNSPNINIFITFVWNILVSHSILNHYKNSHYKTVKSIDVSQVENYGQIAYNVLIDFLLFSNFFTLSYVMKAFYSKTKRRFYLKAIVKRILLFVVYTVLFYANYNTSLSDMLYSKFMDYVPQPHNVVIYNSMPLDQDMRFRLIVTSLLYCFF